MRYLPLSSSEKDEYSICLLVPTLKKDEILKAYVAPYALDPEDMITILLEKEPGKKKTTAAYMKQFVQEELAPSLADIKCKYILCGDAEYFKILTKAAKVDSNLGAAMPCEYGDQLVFYVPNYRQIFYDPDKTIAKIRQGVEALKATMAGSYVAPGSNIIQFAAYPQSYDDIYAWLKKLLEMDVPLTIDIEAFDLKHHKAGIGTISFAWNENCGISFPVDYQPIEGATEAPFGRNVRNEPVRELLKHFFYAFKQKGIYHKVAFDVYILIYQLFMKDITDTEGLLEGMEVMLRDWDDTLLIAYLATNSCAGNELGLKTLAQEHAGNWAVEEITDICRIQLPKLLEYNLVDSLSTWFTYNKYKPIMVADQQEDIYHNVFQPATLDIVQMQLTGLPINMQTVLKVEKEVQDISDKLVATMKASPVVHMYTEVLQNSAWEKDYQDRKNKAKNPDKIKYKERSAFNEVEFNPNSPNQLQVLLYDMLKLPVINLTKTKLPAADGDTLKDLVNHTTDPTIKEFLEALADFKVVDKILTGFIPAMKNAAPGPDGWHYLFGNFNLGGTVSGRLSSSDPNLQNLPAGGEGESTIKGRLGKLIKSCIEAPPGWIFAGLDFASLEDRISALTTKDPNKLKVYLDGFDGHSLRAYAYFGSEMPDIDANSVDSINSIQKKYKPFRQESKAPTFLLTYGGTYMGMMKNLGWPMEKAKAIEMRYHELYVVSDQWVAAKVNQACKDGYITAAFGLRVRTPLLKQVVRGTSKTPYEAEAEGRTAGNALGQSWCLLNSRAWSEFMARVRKSEHRLSIRPCAQIHDAGYALIKEDLTALAFTNKYLVDAVKWQDHPDIAHDEVKLGGELSIFYPNWGTEIVLPNYADEDEIYDIVTKHLEATSQ